MKEIRLGEILVVKRRQNQLTQEDLAKFLGVSKAAVSKWETGMTYPDLTLLPQLASFFDISIDELVGYQPQLSKAEIRRYYLTLSKAFTTLPFADAYTQWEQLVRKYYACYEFIFYMATLLINYVLELPEKEEGIKKAMTLFQRVKENSPDLALAKEAKHMEAQCLLLLNRPDEVISLLEAESTTYGMVEPLLGAAYASVGQIEKSKTVMQVRLYEITILQLQLLGSLSSLAIDSPQQLAMIASRVDAIITCFDLKKLHPGILFNIYLQLASAYLMAGEQDCCLDWLECYVDLAVSPIFPLKLHGDAFFDGLDDWIENELLIGNEMPRSEKVVKKSMIEAVSKSALFATLQGQKRYDRLVTRLKEGLEDEGD